MYNDLVLPRSRVLIDIESTHRPGLFSNKALNQAPIDRSPVTNCELLFLSLGRSVRIIIIVLDDSIIVSFGKNEFESTGESINRPISGVLL